MFEKEVEKVFKKLGMDVKNYVEEPPSPELGDLACTICFELAKSEKRNPAEIAEEIVKKIRIPKRGLIKKVEAKSGYINFFFDWEKAGEKILKEIFEKKEKYGSSNFGEGKRVMVEFSQPNPVHPMHIGHARTTFLGDAISNLLDFLNFKVIRANYINDLGLQVAKLVTAYLLWGEGKKPEGKPDVWLWEYYIKFHEEEKKDASLEEKAREILRKFEVEKNEEIVRIWKRLVEYCVDGFKQTYERIKVKFDVFLYESDFRELGKKIVEEALKKGVAFKAKNAIIAKLEKYNLPDTVILRSDGTGLYITSDLGATVYKFKKFKLDRAIWVVSSEQNLYFKQLFKILEVLGYDFAKNCYHYSYELVRIPEGKMSSREGRAIVLDEVIEKLVSMAYKEVEKRNPGMEEGEKLEIAEKIGISALKYAILKVEPEKQIVFDWDKMLSFQGDTGPYLQYALVRCKGIIRKAGELKKDLKPRNLEDEEKAVLKLLAKFPSLCASIAQDLRIHRICNYAFDLSTAFDKFYEKCQVLKSEKRDFRLSLVEATRIVLENCLKIIGMEILEKM